MHGSCIPFRLSASFKVFNVSSARVAELRVEPNKGTHLEDARKRHPYPRSLPIIRPQREAGTRPEKHGRRPSHDNAQKSQPLRRHPRLIRQQPHILVRLALLAVNHTPGIFGGIESWGSIGRHAAIDEGDGGRSREYFDGGAAEPGVVAAVFGEGGAETECREDDGEEDGAAVGHHAAVEVVGSAGAKLLGCVH